MVMQLRQEPGIEVLLFHLLKTQDLWQKRITYKTIVKNILGLNVISCQQSLKQCVTTIYNQEYSKYFVQIFESVHKSVSHILYLILTAYPVPGQCL